MNSLEFIEKEIEQIEREIKYKKLYIENNPNDKPLKLELISIMIGSLEKKLTHLQQIKCELEAWFVVKSFIRFEEHSRAWIYLNKIYKDEPSYSVIEKNLQKNERSIATVTKEKNEVTVDIVEFEDEQ